MRCCALVFIALAGCGDNLHPGNDPGSLIVTGMDLTTTEGGGIATFTVALAASPGDDVNVSVTSSNEHEGTVSPATLIFTPSNFDIPLTVTVSGVDDDVADGDHAYTVTLDAGNLGSLDVAITNIDDDDPGLTVNPTSGLSTTEAGSSATFTVVLDTQPTANVTIPIASDDPSEGTVAPDALVFTPDNWDAPQVVTVAGVDDDLADGAILYTITLGSSVSSDPVYDGLDPPDVMVLNVDDDSPGVLVTATSGLVTTEAGGTASFTVALTAQPTADVAIAVSSSDPGEGIPDVSSLTFTPVNWNAPQEVTVTGIDDPLHDGDQAYAIVLAPATSGDAGYQGIDPADVAVTNLDNENPGVLVDPASGLVTSESGGTAAFTVKLVSAPSAPVTIPIGSDDATEGTVFPSSLTFMPTDFDTAQTVTVTGVDDSVADGNQRYHIVLSPATSADPAYDGFDPPDASVTNIDNDTPGITIAPTAGLLTSELGDKATFTIVLNSEPTSNVTINLSSNDTTEGTVAPNKVVFTATTWFIPQTVTVTGIDDPIADGNVPYSIVTSAAISNDAGYNGINPPNVAVTNLDDDTAKVIVSASPLLTVSEAGGSATFTMVLTTQPSANVTCALASSDATEGSVSPTSIVFTPADFATAQTVTVTGVDDVIVDGPQLFFIVTAPCKSADAAYNNVNPADVSCRNLDDD